MTDDYDDYICMAYAKMNFNLYEFYLIFKTTFTLMYIIMVVKLFEPYNQADE